tara:strand:+ start:479 stop:1258 length:780 start_codon:yes stop_codon:yes gene_type:complete
MTTSLWSKSTAWKAKARTTEFIGTLPEGIVSATLRQTRSSWSRARQCRIGEDTIRLVVLRAARSPEIHEMSIDIYAAKRDALEILGCGPKPVTPTEMTAAQAAQMGLVYHDVKGDARGYCYCCGRTGFKVDGGRRLSRHGFKRPGWGYTFGECSGTSATPEDTLEIALAEARRTEGRLAASLATDLVEVTLARLQRDVEDARKARRWIQPAEKALRDFEASGRDAGHHEARATRSMLEREQRANTRWLAELERVDAARE